MDEEENLPEEQPYKPLTDKGLNKAMAVMFVLAIYVVIFLKIVFIE